MPKLSPTTQSCKLLKWYIKEGTKFSIYSILCEIETSNLTRVDTQQQTTEMEIEIQEDGIIGQLFAKEGDILSVGSPLAIICDDEKEYQKFSKISLTGDVYNQTKYPMAGWQAYVKQKNENSCGCSQVELSDPL